MPLFGSTKPYILITVFIALCFISGISQAQTGQVGKWKRFETSFYNTSFSNNPFDLEFYGIFKNTASGRTLKQLGFYAGDNTWKIFFMPDRTGEWTFTTYSPDPDLDNHTGSFFCYDSGLPGKLIPEGRRWKLGDSGKYDAPIMIPSRKYLKSTSTSGGIKDFIDWADEVVGARIVGTTLVYFNHAQDEKPYIDGEEGKRFNIPMWDRLNSHYDYLRDKGMGHYIMMYSDDAEAPSSNGIEPKSQEELRLFRYIIARFSCYPMVIWDTGIDIGETRSNSWVEWFADWFNSNDPWQHPVGSRSGGGSGGIHPSSASYYSDGSSVLPSFDEFVSTWKKRQVPTAMTDRWRENYGRGDFDRTKIRRAVWQMGLTGGTAVYVSGNDSGGYLSSSYTSDFQAASDCGHAARFFRHRVSSFGHLYPHPELVVSGSGIFLSADPGNEYVAYLTQGGSIELDLSHATGVLNYNWYNPRTGQNIENTSITGGNTAYFTSPENGDWVLHLFSGGASGAPLPPPTGLRIINID